MRRPQLLIIEDDLIMQRLQRTYLERADYRVAFARNGEQGLKHFDIEPPDLVLLDLGLPGMSGFEVLEHMRAVSEAPIIIVTSKDAPQDKMRGFELGADDYITKPFNPDELVARIKAVLRRAGHPYVPEVGAANFSAYPLRVDFTSRKVTLSDEPVRLTATEYTLLKEFIRNAGRVLTHTELLTAVWGPEYRDDLDLLRTNVYRLRRKIEPEPDGPKFIHNQSGVGYWFEAPP